MLHFLKYFLKLKIKQQVYIFVSRWTKLGRSNASWKLQIVANSYIYENKKRKGREERRKEEKRREEARMRKRERGEMGIEWELQRG